jgi:hypothetical protein
MDEKNLTLLSPEELPITDEVKEKVKVNNLQENLLFLIDKKKCSLADIQKETLIPWPTLYGWYKGDVSAQMLDLNVKELASYFEITIDSLAFDNMREDFEKFIDRDFKN